MALITLSWLEEEGASRGSQGWSIGGWVSAEKELSLHKALKCIYYHLEIFRYQGRQKFLIVFLRLSEPHLFTFEVNKE